MASPLIALADFLGALLPALRPFQKNRRRLHCQATLWLVHSHPS
jgi:hypothetical protein